MKRSFSSSSAFAATYVLSLVFLWVPHAFSMPQAESVPTPTYRASSHLVMLDVVVTDKSGNPVPGLRQEDFVVKENGKAQKITFFTPPNKPASAAAVEPLPKNVYSNAPEYRIPGGVPNIIVMDAANTTFQDQVSARRQMLKFIKQQYKPGERLAVFFLTDKLSLVQDFASDPTVLFAAFKKLDATIPELARTTPGVEMDLLPVRPGLERESVEMAAALENFTRVQTQYALDRRAELTLAAMRCISRVLGGIPGRKNVIWLADVLPFNMVPENAGSLSRSEIGLSFDRSASLSSTPAPVNTLSTSQRSLFAEQIRDVSAQMAASQIAIYPVDLRGLGLSTSRDLIDSQETMREIARETGGRAFVNQNDVDHGVALALRDDSATYTLGYYPENKTWDRKYRTIDLKVGRSGLETTYRRGYFAIDFAKNESKAEQDLSDAWRDQAPDTQVTFEAKVSSGDNGKTRIEFLVDANSLSISDDSAGKKFDVGFYVAAFSPDGKVLASQGTKLDRAFSSDVYQKLLQQGMRLHLDIDVPPASNALRLAVRDNRTGFLGTLQAATLSKN